MTEEDKRHDCSEVHPGCRTMRYDARQQGVTHTDNLPFMLRPAGAKASVLLVHGFTASPWEMRPFAEALAGRGIASLAVRLPGHGTSPEDLASRSWEEWFRCVIYGYEMLSGEFPAVYATGMSTGSLLSLQLASNQPLKGLVLFSPYLSVLHRLAPYAGWLRWLRPYHSKETDNGADEHYYNRRPVAGVHQINRLVRSLKPRLPHVSCPTLAFNGEGDQTVSIESAYQLMAELGSAVKIHKLYGPEVPHVLTGEENPCRQAIFSQALGFIQELENPSRSELVR